MTQIPPGPVVVKINADAASFEAVFAELSELLPDLADAPREFIDGLLSAVECGDNIIRLETMAAAPGAFELTVRAQPTDFLLGLVAAVRARDFELGIFKNCLRHGSTSDGCVDNSIEDRSPGESLFRQVCRRDLDHVERLAILATLEAFSDSHQRHDGLRPTCGCSPDEPCSWRPSTTSPTALCAAGASSRAPGTSRRTPIGAGPDASAQGHHHGTGRVIATRRVARGHIDVPKDFDGGMMNVNTQQGLEAT